MNKKTIQSVFLGMVLLLMYLPILLLAVYSFMDSAIIGRSGSFTVKNYVYLFHSEDLRSMIFGTLILAVIVAVISTILGTLGAIGAFYEAALDLGCSPFGALRKVVLPQLTSGIVSGFMMSITLTLDDYFITTYTKPSMFDTISTYVVNATKGAQTDVKTALWALSTIIFLIVIFVVIGMNHTGRKENDHEI